MALSLCKQEVSRCGVELSTKGVGEGAVAALTVGLSLDKEHGRGLFV